MCLQLNYNVDACLDKWGGGGKKILNCEVMKALSFILESPFLYLCATGQFAGHEREISPSIKINATFVCVQSGEL